MDVNALMTALNADQKKTYEGTCQHCWGTFVVKYTARRQWHLVKHGYVRPGDGYTRGDCYGDFEAPYELSCELVKTSLEVNKNNLPVLQDLLAKLEADKVDTLRVEVRRSYQEARETGMKFKLIAVGRDYQGEESYQTFEYYRGRAVVETQRDIKYTEGQIAFLTVKVAEWRLAPEALADHETAKAERTRRTEEERAQRAMMRQVRHAFEVVASAVREHKDLTATRKMYLGIKTNDTAHASRIGQRVAEIDAKLAPMGGPLVRVRTK